MTQRRREEARSARWRCHLIGSLGGCLLLVMVSTAHGVVVYESTFDTLVLGETAPFPGRPGQDHWFLAQATAPSYGEIQDAVANDGRALHEYTDHTNENGQPTVDQRSLTSPDLTANPFLVLEADFQARSSDLEAVNPYGASLIVYGGPQVVCQIIGFVVQGGNGSPKSTTGTKVVLYFFDGVSNHGPIPLTVGQQLAWNTWHHVRLVENQAADEYVSLTVDGQTQDIRGYALPRQVDGGGSWLRGQLMEDLTAAIAPHDLAGEESDDDVTWDNVSLRVGLFFDGFESGNLSAWP